MSTVDDFDTHLSTDGGLEYRLIESTLAEDGEKAYATEKYLMRVSDVPAFMEESFPQPIVNAGFPTLQKRRTMPGADYLVTARVDAVAADPTRPINLFGADTKFSAATGLAGTTYGKLMFVTINYETGLNNETDSEFLEKSFDAGGEFLHIPPTKVHTAALTPDDPGYIGGGADYQPNKNSQLGIYKRIVTIDYNYRWRQVLFPSLTLWSKYFQALGKVNEKVSKIFNGAAKETVLFSGLSGSQTFRFYKRRTIGDAWSLNFKFSQRLLYEKDPADGQSKYFGWNHIYNPDTHKWEVLRRGTNTGPTLYETVDFDNLFKSTQDDESSQSA